MEVPPLITSTATILDKFDPMDLANIGRPYYFDKALFMTTVEMFIASDELQTALYMLDNPPAWYREPQNYPPEFTEMKNRIYAQTYDQMEYSTDDEETEFSTRPTDAAEQWLSNYCYPRAEIISKAVKELNERGQKPWIHDVGCSHGNLPYGLRRTGLDFRYRGSAVNYRARENLRSGLGYLWSDTPNGDNSWLVCTEVIEHCFNPHDIVHSALKVHSNYDQIFLSVPLGCLYHGLPNWRTRKLGHVRGWTPDEFMAFANKAFSGYIWTFYRSPSMVLHGKKV